MKQRFLFHTTRDYIIAASELFFFRNDGAYGRYLSRRVALSLTPLSPQARKAYNRINELLDRVRLSGGEVTTYDFEVALEDFGAVVAVQIDELESS